jgi:prevent-host-death family protein
MQATSSVYEAKAKLSALINQVQRTGESLILTRHGKPVARLVPCGAQGDTEAETLAELHAAAKKSGISYSRDQLTAPIPAEEWGALAATPKKARKPARR